MSNTNKKSFNQILFNNLVANITNSLVWFAITFWVILQTGSVLATSIVAGIYALTNLITGVFFGSIVDHNLKKKVMLGSSLFSLASFILGSIIYFNFNLSQIKSVDQPMLWIFIITLMFGVVA